MNWVGNLGPGTLKAAVFECLCCSSGKLGESFTFCLFVCIYHLLNGYHNLETEFEDMTNSNVVTNIFLLTV